MHWTLNIRHKTTTAALLGGVCVLVLITNLLGRQDMSHLGHSFASVYEDRLVVEGYIYELSGRLYQKKILLDHPADRSAAQLGFVFYTHNVAINHLLHAYAKTQLTEEETVCFRQFKTDISALQDLERQYLHAFKEQSQQSSLHASIDARFASASEHLHRLSQIQLAEGKMLSDQSRRIVDGSTLLTSFEMVALIVMAILLQILVFAGKPLISKVKQQGQWN